MKDVAIIPVKKEEEDFMSKIKYAIQEGLHPIIVSSSEKVLRKARREGVTTIKENFTVVCPQEYIDYVISFYPQIETFVIFPHNFKPKTKGVLNKIALALKKEQELNKIEASGIEWVVIGQVCH